MNDWKICGGTTLYHFPNQSDDVIDWVVVDADRRNQRIMEMAKIGADPTREHRIRMRMMMNEAHGA